MSNRAIIMTYDIWYIVSGITYQISFTMSHACVMSDVYCILYSAYAECKFTE